MSRLSAKVLTVAVFLAVCILTPGVSFSQEPQPMTEIALGGSTSSSSSASTSTITDGEAVPVGDGETVSDIASAVRRARPTSRVRASLRPRT